MILLVQMNTTYHQLITEYIVQEISQFLNTHICMKCIKINFAYIYSFFLDCFFLLQSPFTLRGLDVYTMLPESLIN